jgi:hypothetical protein
MRAGQNAQRYLQDEEEPRNRFITVKNFGAGKGIRTPDFDLGKVALYH